MLSCYIKWILITYSILRLNEDKEFLHTSLCLQSLLKDYFLVDNFSFFEIVLGLTILGYRLIFSNWSTTLGFFSRW